MNSLFSCFDFLRELNLASLIVKMALAVLFGGLIGLERGQKHRAAGSRTYMIVCMGAAMTVMLAQYDAFQLSTRMQEFVDTIGVKVDVTRFA